MKSHERAYLAGLLDADGSIMLQLKRRKEMRFHFRFKTILVFYQDKHYLNEMQKIHQLLQVGYLYTRNDRICEIRVEGYSAVKYVAKQLQKYITFKRKQLDLLLQAIHILENSVKTIDEFLEVCELSDQIANHNYSSKLRKYSREYMVRYFQENNMM